MKLIKKLMVLTAVVTLLATNIANVSAESIPTEAVYDLEKGGTQTFFIRDEEGELAEVVIEELESRARIANGNYKVAYKNTGAWEAGFYVEVSSNKIIRVYSPFYSVATGSITQPVLVRNSTIKATLSFVYKQVIMSYSCRVVAEIEGTQLIVSKK